jgi:VanZ family protein
MKTQSTGERIWRYAPLIIWMAFITSASSNQFSSENTSRVIGPLLLWLLPNISEESLRIAHLIVRKAAHITEYAILGALAARAFTGSSRPFLRQRWLLAGLILVAVCSLLDEYHQRFIPSRTGSIYDSVLDVVGGLIGLLAFAYFSLRLTGNPKDPQNGPE